jgi:predicted NBD/HSP70 family sugar kinase
VRNFLYIHVSKGVGAGFFLSGSLFIGGIGGAGEFGHITVDDSGPRCHCGNIGCLGKLISEDFLLEKWRQWTKGDADLATLTELVKLSNNGDETAGRLMAYAGDLLGRGIVTLLHLLNPSLIILGGELALDNRRLLHQVKKQVAQRGIPMFAKHVQIEESFIRLNAGIIGAGSLALHHFFENLNMNVINKKSN